ncbi:MAG TPA: tetratricopeptide repeat protein [Candidatus Competibacteraceae bacterium]|nr:tetratricopeptide repeat protein [Candidatus Competibacteraceae bacterium]
MDLATSLSFLKYLLLLALIVGLRRRAALGVILFLMTLSLSGTNPAEAVETFPQWDKLAERSTTREARWSVYIDAGDWFFDNDQQEQAKRYYEKALKIAESFGEGDIRLANTLLKVGVLEEDKRKARQLFTRALLIQERVLGSEHPDLASTLEFLAWTYDYQGDAFDSAVELMKRAIEARRRGVNQDGLSDTIRLLGWLYEAKEQHALAERYYEEALAQDEKSLGANDIRTILAMENLAAFYMEQGEFVKAEKLLTRKLELHLQGEDAKDYYNLARTESALGWLRLKQGDHGAAERYFLQSLDHLNQAVGPEDSALHIPMLLDLVYLYAIQQKYEQAKPYFRRVQEILQEDGEGTIEEHASALEQSLQELGNRQLPWPTEAQALGIRLMLKYVGIIGH